MYPLPLEPPSHRPSCHPSWLSQSTELSPLYYTATPTSYFIHGHISMSMLLSLQVSVANGNVKAIAWKGWKAALPVSVTWLSQKIQKFLPYFFIFTQTRKESVLTTSAFWRFPNWAILPHCNFPLAYPAPDTQSPFCFSRLNPSHPYKFQGPIEKPSLIILCKICTSVYFLSYHSIVFSQNRDFSYLVYICIPSTCTSPWITEGARWKVKG